MNKGELRQHLLSVMNRPDISEAEATFYMSAALTRIARLLRTPAMEGLKLLTVDADGMVELPSNFLDHKNLWVQGSTEVITVTTLDNILKLSSSPGKPTKFTRMGDRYMLGPKPSQGTKVFLYYYVDPQPLEVDADENIFTLTASDLITYAACVDCCAVYVDDRIDAFETLYTNRLTEINTQAALSENVGGTPTVALMTDQNI